MKTQEGRSALHPFWGFVLLNVFGFLVMAVLALEAVAVIGVAVARRWVEVKAFVKDGGDVKHVGPAGEQGIREGNGITRFR